MNQESVGLFRVTASLRRTLLCYDHVIATRAISEENMSSNNIHLNNMVGSNTEIMQNNESAERSLTALTCEPDFVTCCPSGGASCDCRTLPYDLWERLMLGTEVRFLHGQHSIDVLTVMWDDKHVSVCLCWINCERHTWWRNLAAHSRASCVCEAIHVNVVNNVSPLRQALDCFSLEAGLVQTLGCIPLWI